MFRRTNPSWTVVGFTAKPLDWAAVHEFQEQIYAHLILLMSTNKKCVSYIPVGQLEETLVVLE